MGSIPSMLCQNHTQIVGLWDKRPFNANTVKSNVLVMGTCELMVKHVIFMVKREKECLLLRWARSRRLSASSWRSCNSIRRQPRSPGYRLILNNVLFPAAKKKKKT
jgi:hypothetical protein